MKILTIVVPVDFSLSILEDIRQGLKSLKLKFIVLYSSNSHLYSRWNGEDVDVDDAKEYIDKWSKYIQSSFLSSDLSMIIEDIPTYASGHISIGTSPTWTTIPVTSTTSTSSGIITSIRISSLPSTYSSSGAGTTISSSTYSFWMYDDGDEHSHRTRRKRPP